MLNLAYLTSFTALGWDAFELTVHGVKHTFCTEPDLIEHWNRTIQAESTAAKHLQAGAIGSAGYKEQVARFATVAIGLATEAAGPFQTREEMKIVGGDRSNEQAVLGQTQRLTDSVAHATSTEHVHF
ncbi:hypothetical protein GQ44DRAFT_723335 [Phaeosphaeriaceae sp. PMI808]|nr:hypothetical protein GQ44DRAFT_723335 [Phaeosphaeriaceae sp. PMI808]